MQTRLAPGRLLTRLAAALSLTILAGMSAWARDGGSRRPLPTCAVVADGSLEARKSPIVSLVEQRLLRSGLVEVLDRSDIEKVLDERRAQTLFGPQAGAERLAAGKLLKADLVVLLRVIESEKIPALEVIVSESRRGLRLCTRTTALTAPEADAATVDDLVRQAVRKQTEKIEEVCVVPPFLGQDLTPRHDDLKRAYAKLVEQIVLGRPGVLIVELDEARALAREAILANTPATMGRKLPLYLMGEYRNEGDGERRRVTISLSLRRGEAQLGSSKKAGLAPEDAPTFLRAATRELLDKVVEAKGPGPDPESESRQLASRAREFLNVGSWPEALTLTEASLLVKPDQPTLHRDAAVCLVKLSINGGAEVADPDRALACHDLFRRALDHFEIYLRVTTIKGNEPWVESVRAITPSGPAWGGARDLAEDILRAKRAMLLRLLQDRLKRQIDDRFADQLCVLMPWKIGKETKKEEFASMARVVGELEHLPGVQFRILDFARFGILEEDWDSPEVRDYIAQLAKSPNKGVREGAEGLRKEAAEVADRVAKRRGAAAAVSGVGRPALEASSPEFLDVLGKLANSNDAETRGAAEMLQRKLRPESLIVGKPEVHFRTIGGGDGTRAGSADLRGLAGCLPAGDGVDVFWSPFIGARVCLLKGGGRWITVFSKPNGAVKLGTPCYDGHYVWVPILQPGGVKFEPPSLIVIDPLSERTWEVSAKDGLPFPAADGRTMGGHATLAVAPLAPGKVLAAGSFGPAWLATVNFEPESGASVKVIHEARVVSDPGNLDLWKSKTMAFQSYGMNLVSAKPVAGGPGGRRVLIHRINRWSYGHPLLFDPETLAVEVVQEVVNPVVHTSGVARNGVIYWLETVATRTIEEKTTASLMRIGLPDFKPAVVADRVYEGTNRNLGLAFDGDQPIVIGDDIWAEDAPGAGFRRLRAEIPESKVPGDPILARSQHLGLLLLRESAKPYQVQFSDRRKKP